MNPQNIEIEDLKALVQGYAESTPTALQELQSVTDWRMPAALELQRRATRLLNNLDEATLRQIANGDIDLLAICKAVKGY